MLDASDVVNHKPHPEGVLKVLELLDVSPAHAVMVGDTIVDIKAGKNAGCAMTIGVTHGFGTRTQLQEAGATHVVDALEEMISLLP